MLFPVVEIEQHPDGELEYLAQARRTWQVRSTGVASGVQYQGRSAQESSCGGGLKCFSAASACTAPAYERLTAG